MITAKDYYPFGMRLPKKEFRQVGKNYRFSINGQEKETDINDNITTAQYWEYDSRIGRRWNIDPKPDGSFSQYSVFNCNPIYNADPLGDSSEPGAKIIAHHPKDNTGYAPNGDLIQMGPSSKIHVLSTNLGTKNKEDFRVTYFFIEGENGGWTWNNDKKAFVNSKGVEFSNGLATAIYNALNPGRNLSEAAENIINGTPLKDTRQAYNQYKSDGGNGGIAGFVFTGITGSIGNWWGDLNAGGNRSRDAWIGLWNFSSNVAMGPALANESSFNLLSMKNGFGPFGENGLRLGSYRIDMLYKTPASGIGHGTLFSLKQMKRGGNMLRWDYGTLHNGGVGWHSTFRFNILGKTFGSSAQKSAGAPFNFWNYRVK